MRLPASVLALIENEIARHPAAELVRAARLLTEQYRGERNSPAPLLSTAAQKAAYLAMRMPATYVAISAALLAVRDAAPDLAPTTLLDLGAGPATATLAAHAIFPSLFSATLIEHDPHRQRFAHAALSATRLHNAEIITADLANVQLPTADLVLCAYTLNELAPATITALIERAWSSARAALVIVEPGSRAGFANILSAREFFIAAEDAHIAAPCPGAMPCPLAQRGDWCHFAARVQRTALHRRLKQGELSYEDEKFSYVAAFKVAAHPAEARIVRRPEKLKGHTKLALCTPQGLQLATISRKYGELYKLARDAEWGDRFPQTATRKQPDPQPEH